MSEPMPDLLQRLPDDDYLPLRSLNDLLYCERRCALHRIEGVWTDNAATLEGTFAHKRADKPVTWESSDGVREVHGLWLKSDRLRLVGEADVVEFHSCGPLSPKVDGANSLGERGGVSPMALTLVFLVGAFRCDWLVAS